MHDAYQFIEKPLPILKATTLRFYAELAHETKMILAQRFREKLRLTDVADAVNCSPYFLCRVFNQETGLSIHQYLQRVRLFHALEQLAEQPTQDLAALALSLGFASHSHFSTTFVREFGLSPSQFRSSSTSGDWRGMSKILKA
jgi:AraC-like DNA-binding protein